MGAFRVMKVKEGMNQNNPLYFHEDGFRFMGISVHGGVNQNNPLYLQLLYFGSLLTPYGGGFG